MSLTKISRGSTGRVETVYSHQPTVIARPASATFANTLQRTVRIVTERTPRGPALAGWRPFCLCPGSGCRFWVPCPAYHQPRIIRRHIDDSDPYNAGFQNCFVLPLWPDMVATERHCTHTHDTRAQNWFVTGSEPTRCEGGQIDSLVTIDRGHIGCSGV